MTDDYREGGTLILQRPLEQAEKKPPAGDACLVNLHPPGPDIGRRIALTGQQYIVGRDTELRLTTNPASLSRPTMYCALSSGIRRPMSGPGGCRLTMHASPAGFLSEAPSGRGKISVPPSR